MARTTLNLDDSVLADLKRLQRKEGKALGDLVSELLAAIAVRGSVTAPAARLQWVSRPMGALVGLDEREVLSAALDMRDTKQRPRS